MIRCVVGFMFDATGERVVLIDKRRPTFHAGLWNGVGGKANDGESSLDAMWREFKEETGVASFGPWSLFCRLKSDDYRVNFFRAFNTMDLDLVRTVTDEEVHVVRVHDIRIRLLPTCPNLRWLIPMALTPGIMMAEVEDCELERRAQGLTV